MTVRSVILHALGRAVDAAAQHAVAALEHAVADAAERETAEVRRGVEVGHERLQRMAFLVGGRRNGREERLEQRLEILAREVRVERRLPGARVRVDDRELDLLLVGVEVEEERVDLVDDLGDARVGPVDLVDDQDHVQLQLERLAQHEAGLGQRALAGVDQQQHAVDHRQPALDLAAEVGVPGRVDDVDLRPAVAHGRVLGQDRDALLALEIARVEHAILYRFVLAEGPGLPQHRVDQRRLAMVDVRDDRHVADVCAFCHNLQCPRPAPCGRQEVQAGGALRPSAPSSGRPRERTGTSLHGSR